MKQTNSVNLAHTIQPKKQQQIIRWYSITLWLIILLTALLISITGYKLMHMIYLKNQITSTKIQLEPVHKQTETLATLRATEERIHKQLKKIDAHTHTPSAHQYLKEIAALIPEEVRLRTFQASAQNNLSLDGETLSTDALMQFITALNKSSYFKNITLASLHNQQYPSDKQKSIWQFSLKGMVNTH